MNECLDPYDGSVRSFCSVHVDEETRWVCKVCNKPLTPKRVVTCLRAKYGRAWKNEWNKFQKLKKTIREYGYY
jgi:hypothetical protein